MERAYRDWVIIANPVSGGGRGKHAAEAVSDNLTRAGAEVQIKLTEVPGHGRELTEEALTGGVDCIVVCGGDGTIQEVATALIGKPTPLGIVPCGRCNDLARALGIPTKIIPAIDTLINGTVRQIDLGMVNDRPFCTVATFGFDAEVSRLTREASSLLSGTAAYLYTTLKHLRRFKSPLTRLSGDFGNFEGEIFLVATGNTSSYGGGMRIVPSAVPDDGQFDVCIVSRLPIHAVLHLLPRVFWGGHIHHPAVRVERTTWLTIETDAPCFLEADGEPIGQTSATLRIKPDALSVIC
jgi:diacylglycerol kinase (ATP)